MGFVIQLSTFKYDTTTSPFRNARGYIIYYIQYTCTGLPIVSELGHLVGSYIVHSFFGDDTDIDVVAWAEVIHNSSMDGHTHQLLRLLQLRGERHVDHGFKSKTGQIRMTNNQCWLPQSAHDSGSAHTSMSGLNPSSRIPRAARSPDPAWTQSIFTIITDPVREWMMKKIK